MAALVLVSVVCIHEKISHHLGGGTLFFFFFRLQLLTFYVFLLPCTCLRLHSSSSADDVCVSAQKEIVAAHLFDSITQ